jgi:hypothetical protein
MMNTGLRVSEVEGITLQSIEEIDLPDGSGSGFFESARARAARTARCQ